MKTQLVPIETMKKGDQWNQHGGVFELLEDPHASSSHVEGFGPSDVVAAPCVCVSGECGGYFQPGSEWTIQGRVNLVKVHKIG